MKKACFVLALILILFTLCSCGGHVNNYFAIVMITSCHGNEAHMEFDVFTGTYNFKLRSDDPTSQTLDIEASLAEGEMNIYISAAGEKELLRTVKGGDDFDETITLDAKYDNERSVYIILESAGKCVDGDFKFEYDRYKQIEEYIEQSAAGPVVWSCGVYSRLRREQAPALRRVRPQSPIS